MWKEAAKFLYMHPKTFHIQASEASSMDPSKMLAKPRKGWPSHMTGEVQRTTMPEPPWPERCADTSYEHLGAIV